MKKMQSFTLCVLLALSASACLKTRAQLREEQAEDDAAASQPTPVHVQEAQPQAALAIDELKTTITQLNGRIEDLEHAQARAAQNQSGNQAAREQIQKLETRIQELETAQAQMLDAIQKLRAATPPSPAETAELFEKARTQYAAGDYSGAVESLSTYLKNPKAPRLQDGTFLRGEAYFNLKQFKKAIVDYSKFPEKFQNSRHTPTALLKIAQSFEALGMRDDARSFYQELVEKFPKSPEAKKARPKTR